jgi:hypothetical protein
MALVATAAIASACGGSGGTASASPSPSPSPSATALNFKLNGINTTASGTITLIAQVHSFSVELVITGLPANSSHISHIHVGSCQQRGNISLALNQVVADGQGHADIKTTIPATYPPATGTWYVVVHAGPDMQGSSATYLLCGNLFV